MEITSQDRARKIEELYFGERKISLGRIGDIVGCSRQWVHSYIIRNYGKGPKTAQKERYLAVLEAKKALDNHATQHLNLGDFLLKDEKSYKSDQTSRNHLYSSLRKVRILEDHFRDGIGVEILAKEYGMAESSVLRIIYAAQTEAQLKQMKKEG